MRFLLRHLSDEHFCRLSFEQSLWEARPFANPRKPNEPPGEPSYGSQFIVPRSHPQLKELEAIFAKEAQEKWGNEPTSYEGQKIPKWLAVLKTLQATDNLCLHNGDLKSWPGYEGNLYISARSKRKPLVVDTDQYLRDPETGEVLRDKDGQPLPNLVLPGGKIYGGCYVNASLDIFVQDNGYGKRMNAGLRGVQYAAEGDAFASGPPAKATDFDLPDMSPQAAAAAEQARQEAAHARASTAAPAATAQAAAFKLL